MKRQRNEQWGHSIIVAVVVAVVVVGLGAIGWLVYQHNRPQATEAAQNAGQSSNQQTSTPTTNTFITINEWGVKAPYAASLKLSYTVSADGNTVRFSSDKLTALSSKCTGRGGSIFRWLATDTSDRPVWARNQAADDYLAGRSQTGYVYAHIGDYYYVFVHDQAACGDPSLTAAMHSQTNDIVKALVTHLQTITN